MSSPNTDAVEELNEILHEYRGFIIGRMGIPYRQKKMNIISIAVDAPQDVILRPLGQDRQAAGRQLQDRLRWRMTGAAKLA